jgi:hypothetical protein
MNFNGYIMKVNKMNFRTSNIFQFFWIMNLYFTLILAIQKSSVLCNEIPFSLDIGFTNNHGFILLFSQRPYYLYMTKVVSVNL